MFAYLLVIVLSASGYRLEVNFGDDQEACNMALQATARMGRQTNTDGTAECVRLYRI